MSGRGIFTMVGSSAIIATGTSMGLMHVHNNRNPISKKKLVVMEKVQNIPTYICSKEVYYMLWNKGL